MNKLFSFCLILLYCTTFSQTHKTLNELNYTAGDILCGPQIPIVINKDLVDMPSQVKDSLQPYADLLKMHPEIIIELSYYDGEKGSAKKSLMRSQSRAEEYKRYLVKLGLEPTQIIAIGYGKMSPRIPNSEIKRAKTKDEKNDLMKKNSRFEVKVLEIKN